MGPALYVYDDGEFTEQDMINIQHIAYEGKKDDVNKTGKFGVGFQYFKN